MIATQSKAGDSSCRTSTTIAVVDDDPSHLKGVDRLLRAYGYRTIVFNSAERFLSEKMANNAGCLVLDIHLGGMSGLELYRQVAASALDIPVIFMTADHDPLTYMEAQSMECVAYLRKPFAGQALVDAVDRAVARAGQAN
jgi:FixJ family two-component response regulator